MIACEDFCVTYASPSSQVEIERDSVTGRGGGSKA